MNITYCVGITAIAAIWLGAKPSTGYLARVGPAPLRFQEPPRGPDVTVFLPPLAMKDPDPEPEFYGPPIPEDFTIVTEATVEPAAPAPQAPVLAPDPALALSPQMLIQFFNRRGTNDDFNVVVPYQFNPPAPLNIPPPPSSATYQVK